MKELLVRPPSVWDDTMRSGLAGMTGAYRAPKSRVEFLKWCSEFGEIMRDVWKPWVQVVRGPDVHRFKPTIAGPSIRCVSPGQPIGMAFVAHRKGSIIYGVSACHPRDARVFSRGEGLYRAYQNRHETDFATIKQASEDSKMAMAATAISLMPKIPHMRVVGMLVSMLCLELAKLETAADGEDIHTQAAKIAFGRSFGQSKGT